MMCASFMYINSGGGIGGTPRTLGDNRRKPMSEEYKHPV